MITQQHENEIQQKSQAPSSVKEHRWIVVLCSILGVALPMVGGWWTEWPLVDILPTVESYMTLLVVGVVLLVVPVTIGAFLLCFAFRTWWVAVFAGVTWIVGNILATVIYLRVLGDAVLWSVSVGNIELELMMILFSMILGAACAYPLVKWRTSRQEETLVK